MGFCYISKLKKRHCDTGPITTIELKQAKLLVDKHVQLKHSIKGASTVLEP